MDPPPAFANIPGRVALPARFTLHLGPAYAGGTQSRCQRTKLMKGQCENAADAREVGCVRG